MSFKVATFDYYNFLQYIFSKTVQQTNEFCNEYGKEPNYIKISEMVYSILKGHIEYDGDIEKYCGLIVCVTPTIEDLEIEVF